MTIQFWYNSLASYKYLHLYYSEIDIHNRYHRLSLFNIDIVKCTVRITGRLKKWKQMTQTYTLGNPGQRVIVRHAADSDEPNDKLII